MLPLSKNMGLNSTCKCNTGQKESAENNRHNPGKVITLVLKCKKSFTVDKLP